MARRSAWEPRWKYQAGRQKLCMHAADEAALEGEWFDEPQPEPPPKRVKRKYTKRAQKTVLEKVKDTEALIDLAAYTSEVKWGTGDGL